MFLVLVLALGSCSPSRIAREEEAAQWIQKAAKPIKVVAHNTNDHFMATRGSHYYTLIDHNGNVYLAQRVRFNLPQVIE